MINKKVYLQNYYVHSIIKLRVTLMFGNINSTTFSINPNKQTADFATKPAGQILAARNKAFERDITPEDKLKAGTGALLGTLVPMIFMMKKQNIKNPLKLKYGLSEMVTLSASSIVGGVALGMIGEDKKTNENKAKEGLFQFLNASIPTWIVAGVIKLCESSKNFNNIPGKIMSLAGGLIVGMYGAASVSNLICDPFDKRPDRKLTLKDCLINIDDALGVLVLAKFPLADKLHVEKFLPLIFTYCGYRAGKSN